MKENTKFYLTAVAFIAAAIFMTGMLLMTVTKLKKVESKLETVEIENTELQWYVEELEESVRYNKDKLSKIINTGTDWNMGENGEYCYHYDSNEKVIKIKKIKK